MAQTVHISSFLPGVKNNIAQKAKDARKNNAYYINYPFISGDDLKQIFKQFKQFRLSYNLDKKYRNARIKKYNEQCVTPTATEQKLIQLFAADNKKLFTKEYNTQVLIFNTKQGKQIAKLRKYQSVKKASEVVFAQLIYKLIVQLRKHNAYRQNAGYSTRILRNDIKVLISRKHLSNMAELSEKTVFNHLKRFREAGIISNYEHRGRNLEVKLTINPKILQISDGNLPKQQRAQNERFNPLKGQKLPQTVHLPEQKGKKENNRDDKSSLNKELPKKGNDTSYAPASHKQEQRKNTLSKDNLTGKTNKILPAAPKNVRKISKNLQMHILLIVELANNLVNGKYKDYTPIRNNDLWREVFYGTFSRDEFRELMIQEFIKTAAKIWNDWTPNGKPSAVYFGVWLKTIKMLYTSAFKTNNGHVPSKETQLKLLIQYKWRLKQVHNYKRLHPETKNKIANPYQYFNPYRKKNSFAATQKWYLKHLKQTKLPDSEVDKQKKKAYKSDYKQVLFGKISYQINKFYKTRDFDALMSWADTNAPEYKETIIRKLNNIKNAINYEK